MKTIQLAIQTTKNPTNISTNPETQNLNTGQRIANLLKTNIIESYIPNHRTMAPVNAAQTSSSNEPKPTKIPAFLQRCGIATMSLLTAAQVSAEEPKNTTTKEPTTKVEQQANPLEAYKLKVGTMTEKELRAEADKLEAKVQTLVKAGATEETLNPLLDLFDVVMDRLEPIMKAKSKELDLKDKKLDKDTEGHKLGIKERQQAREALKAIQEQLNNPEKADHKMLLKKLQEVLEIHKKYNPELYASNK